MANSTTRLGLVLPVGTDPVAELRESITANATTLDDAAVWQTGTLATRPSSGMIAGTVYRATDTGDVSITDGTSWYSLAFAFDSAPCQVFLAESAVMFNPGVDPQWNTMARASYTWTVQTDPGSHFAAGVYTVPEAGIYRATINVLIAGGNGAIGCGIVKNDIPYAGCGSLTNGLPLEYSAIVSASAGDRLTGMTFSSGTMQASLEGANSVGGGWDSTSAANPTFPQTGMGFVRVK